MLNTIFQIGFVLHIANLTAHLMQARYLKKLGFEQRQVYGVAIIGVINTTLGIVLYGATYIVIGIFAATAIPYSPSNPQSGITSIEVLILVAALCLSFLFLVVFVSTSIFKYSTSSKMLSSLILLCDLILIPIYGLLFII